MRNVLRLLAVLLLAGSVVLAADWPQFRGPNHDGYSPETGLLKEWPKEGPKLLWKTDKAGLGYAGMAIVGGTLYTMGARGDDEFLLAFDSTGKEKWATKMGPVFDFDGNDWSKGPNATPTVADGHVYGVSSNGMLLCVKAADGAVVWKIDMPKELEAQVNPIGGGEEDYGWGYSWSPAIDGDVLVITPGGPKGLFAAVDRKSGKVLWRSSANTKQATYSSPIVGTLAGVKQYFTVTQDSLVAVSAKDGSVVAEIVRDSKYPDVVCATLFLLDDALYLSVGYGGKSQRFKAEKKGDKVVYTEEYTKNIIGNRQGGIVKIGNYAYGFNETRAWACQDLTTGDSKWRPGRQEIKSGAVIGADNLLFAIDEQGKVGLIEASPKAYKELSMFDLPAKSTQRKKSGKVWTHPSLSDGKLYLRDQEFIFCYQVK